MLWLSAPIPLWTIPSPESAWSHPHTLLFPQKSGIDRFLLFLTATLPTACENSLRRFPGNRFLPPLRIPDIPCYRSLPAGLFLGGAVLQTFLHGDATLRSVIEGVIKIVIFVGYMFLVSQMKDIKRVFMYHGAEHKTINCFESGEELTVENVRHNTRFHKRCGTSFLVIVMLVSIILFFFIRNRCTLAQSSLKNNISTSYCWYFI